GVQLNGTRAEGKRIVINWEFTDTKQSYVLTLEDATLIATRNALAKHADASLSSTRDALNAIALRRVSLGEAIQSGEIKAAGNSANVTELFSLLDTFSPNFEIVEPKRASN